MKKILALMLCIIFVCAMPLVAFAEDEVAAPVVEEVETTEDTTEETPTEGENTPPESAPVEDSSAIKETAKTITEKIESWILKEKELLIALITIVAAVFYRLRDSSKLNKSIIKLNNNAVDIANNSMEAISGASGAVTSYSSEISALLTEFRKTAEDNKKLEAALSNVEGYLINAKRANIELSNEVAELLVLANIPNSKKEELYARHRAAVDAIADIAEVIENDGKEA
jgi:hypothetical protein